VRRSIFSFRYIATVLLTLAVLILGGLNVQQKRLWIAPDDGCSWIQSASGISARLVVFDGPCYKAGIRRGDLLKAINGVTIRDDRHVTQVLYELGLWSKATYTLERNNARFETTIVVAPPLDRFLNRRLYLEIIGLLYFLVGIFVLLKRSRAPHALHFYAICVTSFVFYVFHFTGKFNAFDWTIYWFDLGASLLLPPLFLHFCLEFPIRKRWFRERKTLIWLVYLPGGLLFLVTAAFTCGVLSFVPSPLVLRNLLDNLNDFHFGLYFLLSASVLIQSYRTVQVP
jgi:hypothetical protein